MENGKWKEGGGVKSEELMNAMNYDPSAMNYELYAMNQEPSAINSLPLSNSLF